MIARIPGWQAALIAHVAASARRPFRYGEHDCALFTLDALAVMTGTDLASPFRGRYTTFRGGIRILRRAGFRDHLDLVGRHLAETSPASAGPGDLVVLEGAEGSALGVLQGEGIYCLRPSGLAVAPRAAAQRAFEVP